MTLGIAMFATSIMSSTSINIDEQDIKVDVAEVSITEQASEKNNDEPSTTKEIVENYFSDIPIMIDIAYCESRYRQYDQNGNVLRGEVNPADLGVMQINEKYHGETASKIGTNLYTLQGNLAYARYLYESQGVKPWVHSSSCWDTSNQFALR